MFDGALSMRTVLVVAVVACGGRSTPRAAEPAPAANESLSNQAEAQPAELTIEMERFLAQLCACKDFDCASKVSDAMVGWSNDHQDLINRPKSVDEGRRRSEVAKRWDECMLAAQHGAPP